MAVSTILPAYFTGVHWLTDVKHPQQDSLTKRNKKERERSRSVAADEKEKAVTNDLYKLSKTLSLFLIQAFFQLLSSQLHF